MWKALRATDLLDLHNLVVGNSASRSVRIMNVSEGKKLGICTIKKVQEDSWKVRRLERD